MVPSMFRGMDLWLLCRCVKRVDRSRYFSSRLHFDNLHEFVNEHKFQFVCFMPGLCLRMRHAFCDMWQYEVRDLRFSWQVVHVCV